MKHLILGSGPVGRALVDALVARGEEVAIVSRTSVASFGSAVSVHALDVRDERALAEVARGKDVVHQCLGLPYARWASEFPALQRAAIGAARAAAGRLVSFENVYMYGAPGPSPFVETSPFAPCSRKGKVRAQMATELVELATRGELAVEQVRASDLFGPGMGHSALGDELVGRAVAGRSPRIFGDPDAPHTWTFVDDAAKTLAAVACAPRVAHRVVHVPSDAPRTQAEVVASVANLLGRPLRASVTPPWMLRLVGLANSNAREMIEMLYEFEAPFIVESAVAREQLGLTHTPFETALAETVRAFGRGNSTRAA